MSGTNEIINLIEELTVTRLTYYPNRFIATYIADFQAKRFLFATDTTVPKLFCFNSIYNNKTVFINLYFAIRMPFFLNSCTIHTKEVRFVFL